MDDPFGTAALRAAVLGAWAASPTRFREDANAEEDLRLGGYADTWFVELAQNAADAADAAGQGGRLRLCAETTAGATFSAHGELRVAKTRPDQILVHGNTCARECLLVAPQSFTGSEDRREITEESDASVTVAEQVPDGDNSPADVV